MPDVSFVFVAWACYFSAPKLFWTSTIDLPRNSMPDDLQGCRKKLKREGRVKRLERLLKMAFGTDLVLTVNNHGV